MRQLFILAILAINFHISFGQLSLEKVVHGYEVKKDTMFSECFKNNLKIIYELAGSPIIKIGDGHFFPLPHKSVFIEDSSDLEILVQELAHGLQWEKKGGKFRLTVAAGGLYLKAAWLSLWRVRNCEGCKKEKMSLWQRYEDFAYEKMRNNFWGYEYEAHEIITPSLWQYLECNEYTTPRRE